ncbi:phosphoglycerate mutase family protein-like protein [Dothidotthia symphoricarpi CBS 119687]|uniref:Phosphoglycerate mutase family protein-like protein n=1 Tax=Dothidotthia symphoricarpi CBS 119687 TaxID=1392245 RepID=A0A6A6AF60_9PLEO|nr:phosphoglycerate mutase family protein-like protein [Dothidotthia symphoricarpi CBS 119687]KAF2130539.1 phosphoglycerate mutase family protein-like protein [Dothidotthia symphoricarpi CBS 119687]
MPPKIHLVRHAQGEHNVIRDYTIRDAVLTDKGKGQCRDLKSVFQHHNDIDIVIASPLRRTIQTAALCFGPTLARAEVPFILLPSLQEVTDKGCDTGLADSAADFPQILAGLFLEGELEFDLDKIDASAVSKGWNGKKGYWAYEKQTILKRAQDLRNWLLQRPEEQILLVTHGAFAHFLTEDWDVADPMIGTAYKNCEHREFRFTTESTADNAHLQELEASRRRRGVQEKESDPHVLDALKTVVYNTKQ